MSKVIEVENLSKSYRLGQINTGTLSQDISRRWALLRGKEDPFLMIGEINDRTVKGQSDFVWSLKDINFKVEAGEAVGIIGRNGAGKSTLLKILSQITSPTKGTIKVKGRIASLLEVGTGFHPELSGRENIFLNGAILGMRKKEITRKFDEIVDFSGVERYIDTPVKRYSSGMYVRLAFAVAAHLESEILIVDEVLAVGDAEFQKKCLGKMSDVSNGEGRTVLFVSHNLSSIKALCSQGLYLENGLVKAAGPIGDVLSLYKRSATGIFDVDGNTALNTRLNRCTMSGRVAGKVRFTSIKIMDEDKSDAIEFSSASNVFLELKYHVYESVDNLCIAIQFVSADSFEPITSNFIPVQNQPLKKGEDGKVIITLHDFPLQPGDYLPFIGAYSLDKEPYDIIDRQVINVPIIEIKTKADGFTKYLEIPYNVSLNTIGVLPNS
ncbi:MAG: ABC transporter ATP-binding protein [Phormidesmis sp. FL-bin-119]|nr:ABC transporter ATP-binding protein [Pedobacter sp.]